MANGLSIDFETQETERMITALLRKVERPRRLMKNVERWVHSQTMRMFRGRRPDKVPIRGVKWRPLKESTVKQKKALVKRGKAIVADRPMVRTGKLRDSLKVLNSNPKGFEYGTRVKSKNGFAYPGFHNIGDFLWLFLRERDYQQIVLMATDYLRGNLKNFKSYVSK
jgi:phage gpG-like protein